MSKLSQAQESVFILWLITVINYKTIQKIDNKVCPQNGKLYSI